MNSENQIPDNEPISGDISSIDNPQKSDPKPTQMPKKSSVSKLIWLLVVIFALFAGWFGYKLINPQATGPRIDPLSLVPENMLYVLETDRPYDAWDELSNTSIWEILQKDQESKEYGSMLKELQTTLSEFDEVLDILANRTVYISAHPYRRKKLDHLFIFDLEGLGMIRTWMVNQDNLTKRKFKENTIYERLDSESKETIYFSFEDNYLIASYTHSLVEASINSKQTAALTRSFDFIDIRKEVMGEGLLRIYLNFKSLYSYLELTLDKESVDAIRGRLPFVFSGLFFDIGNETLLLDGSSNYHDSIETYLNLFTDAGNGGTDIGDMVPASTSVYLSMGFDSFKEFYLSLDKQLGAEPLTGEEYQSYIARTEKFLDIDLATDLANWIDDEIAVVQIESGQNPETALILKAKSAKAAEKGTRLLSEQIRRKTPVRFKAVEYKGHVINYMAVKGLFNLMLGNLFKKFDRPYYTIIDRFVVFSSEPQVLRGIIDDWIAKRTLGSLTSYQAFMDELGPQHSMLVYLQMEHLGKGSGGLIDDETVRFLQSKSGILSHFPQLGLKISPSGSMFKTKLLLSLNHIDYSDTPFIMDPVPSVDINYDSLWKLDPGEQIVITEIEIEDLAAKKQSETDEEGRPKYDMDIKNGLKHGNYFEYHPNGSLKIRGKYKNDLKDGTWKYYDQDGKLEKKEKYKKDVLVGG